MSKEFTVAMQQLGVATRGITVIALGDSITANGGYSSWFEPTIFSSCGRIKKVYNAGVGGDTTDQMIARFDTDVAQKSSHEIWIQTGTNDVPAGNFSAYKASLEALIDLALATGRVVRLMSIPPRTSFATTVAKFRLIQSIVAKNKGIPLYDIWKDCFNVSTGEWKSGYCVADGIHPEAIAATSAKDNLIAGLGLSTDSNMILPVKNEAGAGKYSNPLFVTDTNGDGLADGISKYGNISVFTLEDSSFGKKQVSTITTSMGTDGLINVTSTTVGNKYRVVARVDISGVVNGYTRIALQKRLGGTVVDTDIIYEGPTCFAGELEHDVVMPIGTDSLWFVFYQVGRTSNFSSIIKLERFQVYDLTALGFAA